MTTRDYPTYIRPPSCINLHCLIAGSSKCATKQLSSSLTKILTVIKVIKAELEKYCSVKTNHTEVNNMWILTNSTNLLPSVAHLGVLKATSIQTFDFLPCTLSSHMIYSSLI